MSRSTVMPSALVGASLVFVLAGCSGSGMPYANPANVTQAGKDFIYAAESDKPHQLDPLLVSSARGVGKAVSQVHTALTTGDCDVSATRVAELGGKDRYVVYLACLHSGASVLTLETEHRSGQIVSADYFGASAP